MTLKIASWNINSVRARAPIVERLLDEEQPDILCLQETKVMDGIFPGDLFRSRGYVHQLLNGQKMHHGVAILSRVPLADHGKHDWQDNGEARHVGARLPGGLRLENVYIPAGGDVPDREKNPKFGQKLDFVERMTRWSEKLAEPTLIVGDFNIAPLECDVWSHKALLDIVSHTPIEVEALGRLQDAHGWVDLGRRHIPAPERNFTWWSYRAIDWAASDRGRRLDHMWCSPEIAERTRSHRVLESCRGWERPSDHVPLILEIDA
ncbi:exodeoxyribonuclease III [Sphingomonas ginkgonis]|uniref:Exodeoxyribonuclease III n=1 Tax=Sphingomonas ginkgonis TaxID=2315330 RepID=A0A3R9YGZ9_9SPHN|nr:exodeoxyribonuclease III [Sphingomonas ginkgonis]RST29742.1 exodeoxyribonuclease III [Sphingomonas ginkgonis]